MKKQCKFLMLAIALLFYQSVFADTYSPDSVYNKGDIVSITLNGMLVDVVYLNDQPSSSFMPSTPYDVNNGWLWSVSSTYTGEWVAYHYVYDSENPITVTYQRNTYRLKQELWASASNPASVSSEGWGWECLDCSASSAATCPNPFTFDYFPISVAQQNNGYDGTTPVNASGSAETVYGQGGNFVNIAVQRDCKAPLSLYNNDIYFRDGCDPHAGIGYYGIADNTNVPAPAKRLFADTDTDGPVLYGWNGGALGIRQRRDLEATNGLHIEKIALQWTPEKVILGSKTIPMPLETYTTINCLNMPQNKIAFYASGVDKTIFLDFWNTDQKKTPFIVRGNGHLTINTDTDYSATGVSDHAIQINGTSQLFVLGTDSKNKISYVQSKTTSNTPVTLALNPIGGAVTIGTTNPCNYTLAVGGTIVAEGIYCKLKNNWPDFVFEKNYELPSLSAVENFINENKHLPNVPSATEIQDSEISLGDMNAMLLRKIEELTLYIIEQEKRINELEKKK